MTAEVNLWQKSRGDVTEITGVFALNCEVYHDPVCDRPQREMGPKPRIATCPLCSLLPFPVPRTRVRDLVSS